MTFTRNVPLASQTLSISQPYLLDNTNSSDTIFGTDHYAFSASSNNGLHNTVTQPAYQNPIGTPSATPPDTSAGFPIIYSLNPNMAGNIPVIQFSKGVGNVVPTPLTTLQSISTPISLVSGGTTNVLDCTGLTLLYGVLYMYNAQEPTLSSYLNTSVVAFDGTTLVVRQLQAGAVLGSFISGNILQVKNGSASTMSSVFWTLQILRVS